MDSHRWELAQSIFHAALDLPPAERIPYVNDAAGEDAELRDEVVGLLEEDERSASLLDAELAKVAGGVLDGSTPAMRKIGRYRILRVLGEGGMGVVLLGEHEELGNRVAIKILRDASLSPARRDRFAREQQMLAKLNHPAIARLFEADILPDGTPYFVMEYVEGIPLTDYCRARNCSLPDRLELFRSVCEAVHHAHQRAIIHRDLKPSNILVTNTEPDGAPNVKLLDFGIAKHLNDLEDRAGQTHTALRLMTPAYAAPEQIAGTEVGLYTDVYALGLILHELLCDRPVFDRQGRTPGQVEVQMLEQEPERPSAVAGRMAAGPGRPSLSRRAWSDLDVLCLVATNREPARRYACVDAFARDVQHFLDQEPLEARADSRIYRAGKYLRRNARYVTAATVVIAVLLGTAGFYTVQLREERNRAQLEAAKAQQVSDYLIGLFEAGDPFGGEAATMDLPAILDNGVERASMLASQPLVQAQMLDVLGRIYSRLSDHERAEELLVQALEVRRDEGDPVDLAETVANLGRLYSLTGQRDSAELLLREALAIRERHLPADHPSLGVNLNDLGSVLTEVGRYDEAGTMYRRALSVQRQAYGPVHEELGATLSNLGVNYFNQGQHAAAEPYYREALEVDRAVFGPEHPNVAARLANLALVQEARGEFEAADSNLSEALRVLRGSLGDDHYLSAYYGIQMGSLLRKKGEHERAEAALRQAVATHETVLGPAHPNTTVARNQLALTLSDMGRYEDAEPILRRVARDFRESVGEAHYYAGSSLTQLAHVLHKNGKLEEAESSFRAGLEIVSATLPEDHAAIVLTRTRFGALLVTLGKFAEAEPMLLRNYEILQSRQGPDHAQTREAAAALAQLYESVDRLDQSARFRGDLAAAGASP